MTLLVWCSRRRLMATFFFLLPVTSSQVSSEKWEDIWLSKYDVKINTDTDGWWQLKKKKKSNLSFKSLRSFSDPTSNWAQNTSDQWKTATWRTWNSFKAFRLSVLFLILKLDNSVKVKAGWEMVSNTPSWALECRQWQAVVQIILNGRKEGRLYWHL